MLKNLSKESLSEKLANLKVMKLWAPKLALFLSLYLWGLPLLFLGHLYLEDHHHDFSPSQSLPTLDAAEEHCELCDLFYDSPLEATLAPSLSSTTTQIPVFDCQPLLPEKNSPSHFRNKGPPSYLYF